MRTEQIDIMNAVGDPSRHFASPTEIARHPALCEDDKLKLLRTWENDALQLEAAANENFFGGEPSRLPEVKEALRLLRQAG